MRIKYVTKRTGKTVAYDGRYIARAVRLAAVSAGDYDEDMVEQVMQHVEAHLSAWEEDHSDRAGAGYGGACPV